MWKKLLLLVGMILMALALSGCILPLPGDGLPGNVVF